MTGLRFVCPAVSVLLVVCAFALILGANRPASAQETTLNIQPITGDEEVGQGEEVTVELVVGHVRDLGGYSVTLEWDLQVLRYEGFECGDFLVNSQGEPVAVPLVEDPGVEGESVTLGCWYGGVVKGYEGTSGSGLLASITFRAKNEGRARLRLIDSVLLEPELEICPPVESGLFLLDEVDVTRTEIAVADETLAPVGRTLLVEDEKMVVTAVAPGKLVVERGAFGTTAASHAPGTSILVEDVRCPPVEIAHASADGWVRVTGSGGFPWVIWGPVIVVATVALMAAGVLGVARRVGTRG